MTGCRTRAIVVALRLVLAAAAIVGLVGRYLWGLGAVTFDQSNFIGYLTIQSNIAFAAVTVVAAVWAWRRSEDSAWLTTLRAVLLSCTVTSGIVFAIIVQQAGMRALAVDLPWSDQLLHFWLPVAALLEWMLSPGRGRAHWATIAYVIGYALSWGALTMLRGSIVGWYPYFFLDPVQVGDPLDFLLYCGLALAVFAAVGTIVVGITRIRIARVCLSLRQRSRRRATGSSE